MLQMVTSWAITECTPEGTEQVYSNWTPRSNKYSQKQPKVQ